MSEPRAYTNESQPASGEYSSSRPIVETPLGSGEYSSSRPIVETPPGSGEYSSSRPIVETPPPSGEHPRRTSSQDSFGSSKMSGSYGHYGPNPGTYVIQIPKDQIYRVPPPENEHKFKRYTRRENNKNCCRSCICYTISTIFILIVLLGITIGILFLIYHPKLPTYAINSVHVKGVNLTSTSKGVRSTSISPVFNITVKTENPNGKISIYYEQGSKISIYHDEVNFVNGKFPAFYQAPENVTVFSTEVSGAGLVLSKSAREKLVSQQKKGKLPLTMDVTVPVKVKVGSVKFWTTPVRVKCDVTVNGLTVNAKIVTQNCKVRGKIW